MNVCSVLQSAAEGLNVNVFVIYNMIRMHVPGCIFLCQWTFPRVGLILKVVFYRQLTDQNIYHMFYCVHLTSMLSFMRCFNPKATSSALVTGTNPSRAAWGKVASSRPQSWLLMASSLRGTNQQLYDHKPCDFTPTWLHSENTSSVFVNSVMISIYRAQNFI